MSRPFYCFITKCTMNVIFTQNSGLYYSNSVVYRSHDLRPLTKISANNLVGTLVKFVPWITGGFAVPTRSKIYSVRRFCQSLCAFISQREFTTFRCFLSFFFQRRASLSNRVPKYNAWRVYIKKNQRSAFLIYVVLLHIYFSMWAFYFREFLNNFVTNGWFLCCICILQ